MAIFWQITLISGNTAQNRAWYWIHYIFWEDMANIIEIRSSFNNICFLKILLFRSIISHESGHLECFLHFSRGPCINPNETPQLLAIKVSGLKALLCSMSTVQSYLTSEAFLLALQPLYEFVWTEKPSNLLFLHN